MSRQTLRRAVLALGVMMGGAFVTYDATSAQAQVYGPVAPGWAPPPLPP
ncbi:hypothetical protein HUK84_21835, partial [Nguyenibacter vanlangensis]|nr:hypothetical protein [Nguyenibacter vanlangensis]